MRVFRQKIIRNPWVLAFLGFLVLAVITFALNLPSHISTGEKGQTAMEMSDAMRRPFLEIKKAETLLIGTDDRKLAISDFNKAVESGNNLLVRYRQLAVYNPELFGRVSQLAEAYEDWLSAERMLFDHFRDDSISENSPFLETHIIKDLHASSAGFLNTMDRLGEGEIPIHEDISKGRMATRTILTLLGLLLLYMIGLIIFQQRTRTRELELEVAMTTADLKEANKSLAQEIIDRKEAQEEVEKSLSLQRATLESTADGILVVNDEGKMAGLNQRFIDMWRIPESIVSSKNDNQALAYVLDQLKDPEGFLTKVRELYSQPDAESFDALEFKDGRLFERYSRPQRIGERVVGRVWSFRDVTERKRAEEAVRESEERFRSVAQSANDAIISADSRGRIISWNKGAHKIFGYSEEEVLGEQLIMLMPERYRDAHQKGFERLYSTGESRIIGKTVELDGLRKYGAEFPIELSISTWGSRNTRYCSGIIRDITGRKLADEKIKHMAYHDSLTDLPNRATFFECVNGAISAAKEAKYSLALLTISLDRYEDINNTIGYKNGGRVLKEAGRRLFDSLKEAGLISVARLSGNKFGVLLEKINPAVTINAANRVTRRLEEPFYVDDLPIQVSPIVGIALFPGHGEDADILMRRADIAMNAAKKAESNFSVYSSSHDQYSPQRLALMAELRTGISNDQLFWSISQK